MPESAALQQVEPELADTDIPAQRPPLRIAGYRRRRPLWGLEALTPAELRVARHAAVGLSNPQIAALLFVTRGTVESQLHAVHRLRTE